MIHPAPRHRSLISPFTLLRLAAAAIGFSVIWCSGQPGSPLISALLLLLGCVMYMVYLCMVDYCGLSRDNAALWSMVGFLAGWAAWWAASMWSFWYAATGF